MVEWELLSLKKKKKKFCWVLRYKKTQMNIVFLEKYVVIACVCYSAHELLVCHMS